MTSARSLPRRDPGASREVPERRSFCPGSHSKPGGYFRRFDGWRPLGQNRLVVWTGDEDAYLLTVEPPCLDLEYATGISITTQIGHLDQRLRP
ncbi:MAG: DUF6491 family protein [Thermoanaerobaculia bacterium]